MGKMFGFGAFKLQGSSLCHHCQVRDKTKTNAKWMRRRYMLILEQETNLFSPISQESPQRSFLHRLHWFGLRHAQHTTNDFVFLLNSTRF